MLKRLAFVAVLGLLPALASAQQAAGNWEFTLSGAGSNNKEFTNKEFQIQGSVGYFFTKEIEVAARESWAWVDSDAGNTWSSATFVAADYHFDMGAWQPFVGVNIGNSTGGAHVDSSLGAGPEAGVKYFIHKNTFLFGMVQYEMFGNSLSNISLNKGAFFYSFGIGFTL